MPTPTPVKLVATLADLTVEALPAARAEALRVADLVEFRLDRLPPLPLGEVLGEATARAVVTFRPTREGGLFSGDEATREQRLRDALAMGAAFVDVEWDADFADAVIAAHPGRVVLSRHDFVGLPADLAGLVRAMNARHPAIVKLAVTPTRLTDQLQLAAAAVAAAGTPVVLIAMGAAGLPSRILAGHVGSCWTYAGAAIAPGQVTPELMRSRYRVGQHTTGTQVFGVAGRPISHSLSPTLHNAALRALGVDGVYLPFEAQDIDDLLATAAAFDVRGLSVTAPFKLDALARASSADPVARRLGAANTLTRTPDGWVARNTDVEGFLHPLRARLPLARARASVLGAGGAARAVVAGLHAEGARVTVHARRRGQAESLVPLGATVGEWPPPPGSWDLLVNTTPVGTAPHADETPLGAELLGAGALVYDLVYNPGRTRLLREAAAAGCETLGGLEMLIAQAAVQVATWFPVEPPVEAMRAAIHAEAPQLVLETTCPR
ncbi:Shikimate dehydrogenase [Luteitalea pratensis]|uniref:Shikimate dehydrogenase (NADP(+)) n=1 Tax=Luteitalea pratensis TaxID=1855912 RepID=A0A143PQS6_LUTPR|nr:type I 3-dehydroquinate dehydratase [Luteitalea pratensis]AMY10503.1 Shikimate dehydrogenase [Luteitalea pratensis]